MSWPARLGTTLIQMSTVGPSDVARLASSLPQGVELLDAPVLGSLSEAETGTLRVFAGGSADLVEKWEPVLASLGPVLHVGPAGAGTAAKLVANSTLLGVLSVPRRGAGSRPEAWALPGGDVRGALGDAGRYSG